MKRVRAGFPLMEVIIAVAIMAMVSAFIASALPQEFTVAKQTQDIIKAGDLAQNYIEEIKYQLKDTTVFDSVAAGSDPPIEITGLFTSNGAYTITTNTTFVGRTGRESTLKEITVTVYRKDKTNALVTLSTILARPQKLL